MQTYKTCGMEPTHNCNTRRANKIGLPMHHLTLYMKNTRHFRGKTPQQPARRGEKGPLRVEVENKHHHMAIATFSPINEDASGASY